MGTSPKLSRLKVFQQGMRIKASEVNPELDQLVSAHNKMVDDMATSEGSMSAHKASADHDGRYYTEAEVNSLINTVVGQINTVGGALTTHKTSNDHDGRYYTIQQVTDLINGIINQLTTHKTSTDHDGRYYTETESDQILANHKASADHDGRYYTETEVQAIMATHSTSADHDGRYYTETEVNSLLNALQTQITALQGSSSDLEVINARGGFANLNLRLNQIDQKQVPLPPVTLGFTPQSITRTSATPGNPRFVFKPIHYVNLLGKDGNCEDVSKWYLAGALSMELDTTKKVFGNNAFKIITGGYGGCYKPVSALNISAGKYYLATAYCDAGNAQAVYLRKDNLGGGVDRESVTSAKSMTRIALKLQSSDMQPNDRFIIGVLGTSGQYGFVDGIMLNEISSTEYTNDSEAVLMARYPYGEGLVVSKNLFLESSHADGTSEQCVIDGDWFTGDTVELVDGQVKGQKLWKRKTLFGKDYVCGFEADYTGKKTIKVTMPNDIPDTNSNFQNVIGVKYDGKILTTGAFASIGNTDAIFVGTNKILLINVSDINSGWGENYTPTDEEVKAYLNGYIMMDAAGNYYTGTGTKYWARVYCGVGTPTTLVTGAVAVGSSITVCPSNVVNDMGYEGYQLAYKLATPQPINEGSDSYLAVLKGDIPVLKQGVNTVTFDTGVVLGEEAKYVQDATYTNINNDSSGGISHFKNKVELINAIKKNGNVDSVWTIDQSASTNGKCRAYALNTNVDKSATYTSDYNILRTIAPQIGSCEVTYAEGLVDSVSSLYGIVETKQNQSVVLDTIIDKAMYESFTNMYYEGRFGRIQNAVTFPNTIFFSPKLCKPIISIKINTAYYRDSSGNPIPISLSDVASSPLYVATNKFTLSFIYKGSDSTIKTNLETYGGLFYCDLVMDCRGVI